MNFIGLRKYWYIVSGGLVAVSLFALALWGLDLGIDFTGGSLLELTFEHNVPSTEHLQMFLSQNGITNALIQQTEENGVLIRTEELSEEMHQDVLARLSADGLVFVEKRFVSIGPVIGSELQRKAVEALVLVIVMIILYIAWAFRHVSRPVASWKYGLVAIVALVHDVIIPAGFFAFLGYRYGVEVDALFVTALLTILGFSVHDTIVIFDRIRENLQRYSNEAFETVVEKSVEENIMRSLNTSVTLFFVLVTLYLFGSESTRYFALTLAVGTIAGTYSSLFLASPLLVSWERWASKKF
jgi:preprotein translocase subunit SecF